MRPLWIDIVIIGLFILSFFMLTWLVSHFILEYFIELERRLRRNRRSNRIVPIDRLIRIAQLRTHINNHRILLEQEKYNQVMAELKNKVLVINPDDTLLLGIEH
jgi:uncharacterized membrane protein SpoIIM required for sporulation